MPNIEFSEPHHPTDPDSGEKLPTRTTFRYEGVGAGLAEVHYAKDAAGAFLLRLPEVRLIFQPLPPEDLSATEPIDVTFTDDNHTSLTVVSTPALLEPYIHQHLQQHLGL